VKKVDLNRMTREFLMGNELEEGRKADAWDYLHSIAETLQSITPRTKAGERKVQLALEHLRSLRRHTRRLEERVKILEEQVQVLEEGS
tara:strand:+ start:465 stop:728 length:264 start_codon:yes stop_codon:yes gene_type:complete